MKIILVIPTLKQGGAERVMSELANVWSNHHEVHLILLAKSESFYFINDNVTIHKIGFYNCNLFDKIYNGLKVTYKLRKIIKQQRPDFVLSFMHKFNIQTIVSTAFTNIKIFVSDRNNPKEKLPFLIPILRKITYRFANGIIAQTSLAKEILEKNTGNKNIIVIPNPAKEIIKYKNIKKEKIVLNIGRMVQEKGQKYLLEAFSKINNSEWKLVILGDGPLYEELENQVIELDFKNRVIMAGPVEDVDHWLARASIFAFSSVSEGFPNALVEAMAAGLPCVSFDCDAGPRDLILDGKNGYLVPMYNISYFTKRLDKLMKNEVLRGQLSRESKKIKDKLNKKKIADEFLRFCSES